MKYILIATLLTSFSTFAAESTFRCVASMNAQNTLETEIKLTKSETPVSFGEAEGFAYYLMSKSNNAIELSVLDQQEQYRMYSTATVSTKGSFVELSIWKRDYLMEVRCTAI